MITWEQYLYIQSKKDDFMEKHNRRPVSYKKGKIKHELKGLLTCASCGCAIIGEHHDRLLADGTYNDHSEKQLKTLIDMRVRELIDDEEFEAKSKELKSLKVDIEKSNKDTRERNKNWYEVIGNTLKKLVNPKERFNSDREPSARRSLLLAIGPCPVLKEVPFGSKDYGGHVIPRRHRALTVKKIEVEPYKWLEELDETVDQNGEIFSLRALTEKLSVQ